MTQFYPQLAEAEFAIGKGENRVTIKGVPYDWFPEQGDRDSQAAYACARAAFERMQDGEFAGQELHLVYVSSKTQP